MSLKKCEHCGEKFREEDLMLDEDSHDIVCPECYHGDRNYETIDDLPDEEY